MYAYVSASRGFLGQAQVGCRTPVTISSGSTGAFLLQSKHWAVVKFARCGCTRSCNDGNNIILQPSGSRGCAIRVEHGGRPYHDCGRGRWSQGPSPGGSALAVIPGVDGAWHSELPASSVPGATLSNNSLLPAGPRA